MRKINRTLLLGLGLVISATALNAKALECTDDEGWGKTDCIWTFEERDNGEWVTWQCNDGDRGASRVPDGTVAYNCALYGD